MVIREVQDRDFVQLAEMRWAHAVEDDETYGEHNTDGVTKSVFIEEFVAFLYTNKEYKIFVAEDENAKILAAKSKLISVSAFSEKFGFMSTP